jgi:YesN/AraC family two-component response regulator
MAKLLLIDDEPMLRSALRRALELHGHVVTEAGDGKEGLARFNPAVHEAIITDIVMPEMEGLGLLMEVRKRCPSAKVIVMSGGGAFKVGNYLQTAKLLGADAVLSKPFSCDEFVASLNEVLTGGRREKNKADDALCVSAVGCPA